MMKMRTRIPLKSLKNKHPKTSLSNKEKANKLRKKRRDSRGPLKGMKAKLQLIGSHS